MKCRLAIFRGSNYREGRSVPQDYAEAVKWYRKSAEQGNAPAQACLGESYSSGQGVPKDYVEAYKWSSLAVVGLSEKEILEKIFGIELFMIWSS